jgi:DNA polymerase-3 subunit epsilon
VLNAQAAWFSAQRFAVVDLETTGISPTSDAITEIAALLIDDGRVVERWQSLVNPGVVIPPEIQVLTGITNHMVRNAPPFSALVETIRAKLEGRIFVAHNARFDYGFIKNAFRREGMKFTADVLCTVRLSRRLDPDVREHGLDAVAARHRLTVENRHRAMGDAELCWQFLAHMVGERGEVEVSAAMRALLRTPSYPAQLDASALAALPDGPGVYIFHGVNDLPLYIGKSVNLRERVKSHFSADHRQANDVRLSMEIRRVSYEEAAGELGALLRESALVKSLLPLTNQRLRRNRAQVMIDLSRDDAPPAIVPLAEALAQRHAKLYGPYSTRASAKAALAALTTPAVAAGLCWRALGIERKGAADMSVCFARQLRHCHGCCEGVESVAAHHARVAALLAPRRFLAWPYEGAVGVAEEHADGWRVVHVFREWRHVGTARDDAELQTLFAHEALPEFDADVYRLVKAAVEEAEARGELVKIADGRVFQPKLADTPFALMSRTDAVQLW